MTDKGLKFLIYKHLKNQFKKHPSWKIRTANSQRLLQIAILLIKKSWTLLLIKEMQLKQQ